MQTAEEELQKMNLLEAEFQKFSMPELRRFHKWQALHPIVPEDVLIICFTAYSVITSPTISKFLDGDESEGDPNNSYAAIAMTKETLNSTSPFRLFHLGDAFEINQHSAALRKVCTPDPGSTKAPPGKPARKAIQRPISLGDSRLNVWDSDGYQKPADFLLNTLIVPILARFKKYSKILIMPTEELCFLPFAGARKCPVFHLPYCSTPHNRQDEGQISDSGIGNSLCE
jgi:hypothetical protein